MCNCEDQVTRLAMFKQSELERARWIEIVETLENMGIVNPVLRPSNEMGSGGRRCYSFCGILITSVYDGKVGILFEHPVADSYKRQVGGNVDIIGLHNAIQIHKEANTPVKKTVGRFRKRTILVDRELML